MAKAKKAVFIWNAIHVGLTLESDSKVTVYLLFLVMI